MNFFKSFSREKSTQDEIVYFIKENELKVTQVELLLFFIFKSVEEVMEIYFPPKEKVHKLTTRVKVALNAILLNEVRHVDIGLKYA